MPSNKCLCAWFGFVLLANACTNGAGSHGATSGAAAPDGHAAGRVSTVASGAAGGAGASMDPARAAVSGAASAGHSAGQAGASVGAGGSAGARSATAGAAAGAAGGGAGAGALPYKGVANSPCAARSALDVSWYYNWTQSESEPCSDGRGGAFVPMIWGHAGAEQTADGIAKSVSSFVSHGYPYVLGFNEPDNASQANIAVAKAIELWPSFGNAAIQVGSPGTSANTAGQAWFKDFMTSANANPTPPTDFLAIHWYGWNAGSCDAKASQLESYIKFAEGFAGGRPIWITEWGCLNQSAPDVQTVVSFFQGALAVFAKHPRVQRYAWYPWATNCGLVNKDGTLTPLGTAYAAARPYR